MLHPLHLHWEFWKKKVKCGRLFELKKDHYYSGGMYYMLLQLHFAITAFFQSLPHCSCATHRWSRSESESRPRLNKLPAQGTVTSRQTKLSGLISNHVVGNLTGMVWFQTIGWKSDQWLEIPPGMVGILTRCLRIYGWKSNQSKSCKIQEDLETFFSSNLESEST